MEIWHNPRCSKSREALSILEASDLPFVERHYLQEPPDHDELERVLKALDMEPWELARTQEPLAKELGLADLPKERSRWIDIMVENPILIERPVVIASDGRAVIGRPPEDVKAVFARPREP